MKLSEKLRDAEPFLRTSKEATREQLVLLCQELATEVLVAADLLDEAERALAFLHDTSSIIDGAEFDGDDPLTVCRATLAKVRGQA